MPIALDRKTVLHVGCGPYHPLMLHPFFNRAEWDELRLDIDPAVAPDIVASITDMSSVSDESVDALYSSHNLEHLYAHEVPLALSEFHRVLKVRGFLFLTVPDFQAVAAEIVRDNLEGTLYVSPAGPIAAIDIMWGHRPSIAQGNHFMAHKTGFTATTLAHKLNDAGFTVGEVERRDRELRAIYYKTERRALP